MDKAKLTSKGQLTIPRRVRERLGLRPGDRILFDVDDHETVRLHILKQQTVGEFFEKIQGADAEYPGHETERAAARRHVAERLLEE